MEIFCSTERTPHHQDGHLTFLFSLFVLSQTFKSLVSKVLLYHRVSDRGQYTSYLACQTNSNTYWAGKYLRWKDPFYLSQPWHHKKCRTEHVTFSSFWFFGPIRFRNTTPHLKLKAVLLLLLWMNSSVSTEGVCRRINSWNSVLKISSHNKETVNNKQFVCESSSTCK